MIWRGENGCLMKWMIKTASDSHSMPPAYGVPIPIHISVEPYLPGHGVVLEYRINGGPIHSLQALPATAEISSNTRRFQAVLPAELRGAVEYLPVLLLKGEAISPRLAASPSTSSVLQLQPPALVSDNKTRHLQVTLPISAGPYWDWSSNYLGSLTGQLRKELVGPTPDGLRINWHIVEGRFVGPGLEAQICSGTTDWMHILENGIGIVDVKATFKTSNGLMIYGSYGGIFDLGPDGYQKVLDGSEDPFPPLVVTPTYATASQELAWLNRAQCIGVGRVDTRALVVSFDVYRITVGERLPQAPCGQPSHSDSSTI